jgi:hypothetical protein
LAAGKAALVKLRLERTWCGKTCTIGTLTINGVYECFTLEDVVREDGRPVNAWKIPGKTAIPTGTYDVIVTPSARFKRDLPIVLGVPGFDGVRIHPGNTDEDTEGCILVGLAKGPDYVSESRRALDQLFAKIKTAIAAGEKITLEVK